jgi:hypothetical protein
MSRRGKPQREDACVRETHIPRHSAGHIHLHDDVFLKSAPGCAACCPLRECEDTVIKVEAGARFGAEGLYRSGDVFAEDYGVLDEGEGDVL